MVYKKNIVWLAYRFEKRMLALINILDLFRSTVTEEPKFPVLPLTLIRSLRKVSYTKKTNRRKNRATSNN